jgi:serine/threonine protein kinase
MPEPKEGKLSADTSASRRTATWTVTGVPDACATLEMPDVDPRLYRIVREVGRGGMGRILEAVDTRLHREVAIKELINPAKNQARFIREAVLTARLQHPAIVAVHEVGVFANGNPFIAMKLVRGESLRDVIRKRTNLAERLELISAVITVADAVAYAHSQRVIHRDLKPANVLLGSFGEVVVIDWGLAKHLDVADVQLEAMPDGSGGDATQVGAVVGTPAYMPPEQALGQGVDARADVYTLGGILYEVLTGAAPNASGDDLSAPVPVSRRPAVRERVPEVPADLAIIVDKAMRHDVAERYPDAAAFAADLRRFQLGQMLSMPRLEELERDPVIEAAFGEELRDRTTSALRTTTILALVLVAVFAIPPRIYFGRFELRDMVPRSMALITLTLILAASYRRAGRKQSQLLSMFTLFAIGLAGLIAHVLQGGVLEAVFLGSMILIFLGGTALLPITPKRTLLVLCALTILSMAGSLSLGDPPLGLRFVTLCWLLVSSIVIAVVGAKRGYRIRRAEFYNRHRLQRANERLARFDRSRSRGGE